MQTPHRDGTPPEPGGAEQLAERLGRVEEALAAVQQQLAALTDPATEPAAPATAAAPAASGPTTAGPAAALPDLPPELWAITELRRQAPPPGAVVYAGTVAVGLGQVEYQWGRTTEDLLRADWAERAEPIGALGHPLRLAILRLLLDGERTVAQLVDELELASTGIAYHHLHQLQGAGWASSPQRGRWTIPPRRVIPLLAIITALEDA
ncbi:helix-turn-helix domain-containing protein [Brachybacterium hainanense]|uniref:Helix-turn-helix domain-containing protein n=1 Tax=Brachybacterium hainanense TaxID=1541174 RepID=A0ABV6RBT1_9MICO